MSENMTGYERMKEAQARRFEQDGKYIREVAENYHNDPEHIAKLCFNKALAEAVEEIEGWKNLCIKALEEVPYANPKEAKREHDNKMNLLNVIQKKLMDRKRAL